MLEIAELAELDLPLELLDLGDKGELETRITQWREGRATITPRDTMEPKQIRVLRIWVPSEVKPTVPAYYDITSTTLIAGLRGYLTAPGFDRKIYKITKQGRAPAARFTLEVSPAP